MDLDIRDYKAIALKKHLSSKTDININNVE